MKVLWLVSITLPAAAAACGLQAQDVSGGWLTGQLTALAARPDAPELTICSVDARVSALTMGSRESVRFALLPDGSRESFAALLQQTPPDLVHIWGTEYPAVAAMQAAAAAQARPVLIGIQGVMADCAAHLCDGVPAAYRTSSPLQRMIDRVVPGALLDKSQANFDALARNEADVLRRARYLTGRTGFDQRFCQRMAPDARYFRCNETLRPAFYTGPLWQPHAFGQSPVLLLSQGNYPLKNLHTVLQALPGLRKRWPGLTLQIAGWPPLDKGPLLRPVIQWMFPYQRYCQTLARQLGVADCLHYTGPLQADAMRRAFLEADLFVLPSFSENSPNSLGEAMLLGMPCLASRAGGIPDMLQDGREGRIYGDAGNAAALAEAAADLLGAPDHGAALGFTARQRALQTHDPAKNAADLLAIYDRITEEARP